MDVELVIAARDALDALAAVDVDTCDREALDGVLAQWRTVRSFTDVYDVLIARRSRQLAEEGMAETPEGILAQRGRRSKREARAAAAREKTCEQMPSFETALATGDVSAGHIDALGSATHGLDDEATAEFAGHANTLLGLAQWQSVEAFTRECHELARNLSGDEGESRLERQKRQCRLRRWVDRVTGMHHIHAELDPETGSKAWTAINALAGSMRHAANHGDDNAADDRATTEPTPDSPSAPAPPGEPVPEQRAARRVPSWDWFAAQALVELLIGARSLDRRVPEVAIHVDWQTLIGGLHQHSLCETSDGTLLPPSTVRRLCCEAAILPVVLNGEGEVLDLGHSQRLANREQRRALRAMYRTCGYPNCDVTFDRCEIHHVHWWELAGPTNLDNLLPLCSRHHHLVHEGGWMLRIAPDRVITLTRPDGTSHYTGTTINRTRPANRRQPTAA
jgi:Domain of unknown function (DUF222)